MTQQSKAIHTGLQRKCKETLELRKTASLLMAYMQSHTDSIVGGARRCNSFTFWDTASWAYLRIEGGQNNRTS